MTEIVVALIYYKIFLSPQKVKRQKYSYTINKWILSSSFKIKRIIFLERGHLPPLNPPLSRRGP
jgi:hypothetical protein